MTKSTITPDLKRIKILDKEFQVSYPKEQEESLSEAAVLLNNKMTEIKSNSKFCGLEKVAIMTALNLAHDLLKLQNEQTSNKSNLNDKLNDLQNKLDNALMAQKVVN